MGILPCGEICVGICPVGICPVWNCSVGICPVGNWPVTFRPLHYGTYVHCKELPKYPMPETNHSIQLCSRKQWAKAQDILLQTLPPPPPKRARSLFFTTVVGEYAVRECTIILWPSVMNTPRWKRVGWSQVSLDIFFYFGWTTKPKMKKNKTT